MNHNLIANLYYKDAKYKLNVLLLIYKFLTNIPETETTKIDKMIIDKKSDEEIVGLMRELTFNSSYQTPYDSSFRGARIAKILKIIYDSISFRGASQYLDIGSNNGAITVEFGKRLGLTKNGIYGIDIEFFENQKIVPLKGFNFQTYDGNVIPFPDGKFNVMTCLMVLHHVEDKRKIIKEIYRTMQSNGILIIKEHDSMNQCDDDLIYLEHLFYEMKEPNFDYYNFKERYHQYTMSRVELEQIMVESGFRKLLVDEKKLKVLKHNNPTNYYFAAFKK